MLHELDTIVAISTPPGRGGIGVVRISGPQSRTVVAPLLKLRHPLAAGRVRFGDLLDAAGEVLDEAVVTWFAGPRSYTGEDVVEIACHGSPVLLEWVLRGCVGNGARLAEPGEFTQRAFLNGRLDLTQAEAVQDLIASSTLEQARVAARQLGGSLSKAVAPAKAELVELIAALEAGIDFAEDDIDLMPIGEIAMKISGVEAAVRRLAETFAYGRVLRGGFTLAIVGRPNAGKSSLFNRLLERERAIVTAMPGTTRDPIGERLALDGIPVELMDTAGLRDAPVGPEGEAEAMGIARTRALMAEADVVLLVVDASEGMQEEDHRTLAELEGRAPIVVMNKADLVEGELSNEVGVATSALTGAGIPELKQAIVGRLAASSDETAMVTNARQHSALTEALAGLEAARDAVQRRVPHEMVLLDLYGALRGLDSLTGVTTTEEILALIFSSFCIGK